MTPDQEKKIDKILEEVEKPMYWYETLFIKFDQHQRLELNI